MPQFKSDSVLAVPSSAIDSAVSKSQAHVDSCGRLFFDWGLKQRGVSTDKCRLHGTSPAAALLARILLAVILESDSAVFPTLLACPVAVMMVMWQLAVLR